MSHMSHEPRLQGVKEPLSVLGASLTFLAQFLVYWKPDKNTPLQHEAR